METIELVEGVKIVDMFVGISSDREEGQSGRWELNALPREQMSALGTKMYVAVEFADEFEVGDGVTLAFQFDDYSEIQKFGVDKTPQKNREVFDFSPPYKSVKIKKVGKHTLNIFVGGKDVEDANLSIENSITAVKVPYIIVA
jgi:hypothetical protein